MLKIKNVAIIVALAAGYSKVALAETPKFCRTVRDCVHVSALVRNDFTATDEGGFMDRVDTKASHLDLTLGEAEINELLKAYDVESYKEADNVINITIKASVVPFILAGRTEDHLQHSLEEGLDHKRTLLISEVRRQLEDPNGPLAMVPPSIRPKVIEQELQSATVLIDNQLQAVKAVRSDKISERIDDLKLETAVQEVALSFSKELGDGRTLLFFKAGKQMLDNAFSQDTVLDRVQLDERVRNGVNTAATGASQVGVSRLINDRMSVRVDAYFFHDRLPFISGKNYVADVVTLQDSAYERQDNWWKIDSQMVRALLNMKDLGEIYITLGNFNGDKALGTGFTVKITPEDTVVFNYTIGDRLTIGQGANLFYFHKLTKTFDVYFGAQYVEDSYQPLAAGLEDPTVTETNLVAGVSAQKDLSILGQDVDLSGNLELIRNLRTNKFEFVVGTQANIEFGK